MRIAYPSDITEEQFEVICGTLEGAKKKTHPLDYELYSLIPYSSENNTCRVCGLEQGKTNK